MTSPGDVEKVPLKVVPYFVQPTVEPDEPDPDLEPEIAEPERQGRRGTPVAWIAAVVFALGTVALHVLAVIAAYDGQPELGSLLAWIAVGASGVAVLTGILTFVARRGRLIGAIALLVAVLANPYILLTVLRFVGEGR